MGKTIAAHLDNNDFLKFNDIKKRYNYTSNSEVIRGMIYDEATLLDLEKLKDVPSVITNLSVEQLLKFRTTPMALFSVGVNWEDKARLKKILKLYEKLQDQQNAILRTLVIIQTTLNEQTNKGVKINVNNNLEKLKEDTQTLQDLITKLYKKAGE